MPRSIVILVAAMLLAVRMPGSYARALPVSSGAPPVVRIVRTSWPNGTRRTEATLKNDAYDGEFRSWYANGAPFERRHYASGHEAGLQQAWSDAGTLYINYEARDGRHYGMENSTPCVPAEKAEAAVPYFDDPQFTPHWASVAHRIGAFRLTRQTGDPVTEHDLDGRIHVASFIYTRCAAVCPLLVRQLSRLQEATRTMPDVTIVSYTVTPDADSPAVLAAFGRDRGIDAAKWWLVTGDRRQIYGLARRSYFAADDRVPSGDQAEDFLHTEKVVLVDTAGHLRGIYNGTQPFQMDQLIGDIARLRAKTAVH